MTEWFSVMDVKNGSIRSARTYQAQCGRENQSGFVVCVHNMLCTQTA